MLQYHVSYFRRQAFPGIQRFFDSSAHSSESLKILHPSKQNNARNEAAGTSPFFLNHNGDNTLRQSTATAITLCIHCPQGNINNHRLESLKMSKFKVMHCLRKMVLVSKLLTVHQIHDHHHGITVGKRMFSHLK